MPLSAHRESIMTFSNGRPSMFIVAYVLPQLRPKLGVAIGGLAHRCNRTSSNRVSLRKSWSDDLGGRFHAWTPLSEEVVCATHELSPMVECMAQEASVPGSTIKSVHCLFIHCRSFCGQSLCKIMGRLVLLG